VRREKGAGGEGHAIVPGAAAVHQSATGEQKELKRGPREDGQKGVEGNVHLHVEWLKMEKDSNALNGSEDRKVI